jgi:tRNA-dihydrouridine synthase A
MMDWTDRHCRYFHRLLSPRARLYTEMVVAQAIIHGDRERLLGFDAFEQPVALQLGGSDPQLLAQAARIGADFGYAEINLNCGCPSDRVQSGRFGACLMFEPALVANCVAAMRAVCSVPITVKCRLGVDQHDDDERLHHFIACIQAAGCDTVIVHARKALLKGLSPKENREIPPLQYERVHAVKKAFPTMQVVLNGGLETPVDIATQLQHVDGVMLGRAAYHDPYLLAKLTPQLFAYDSDVPSREEVLARMHAYAGERISGGDKLKHITRHVLGLYQGLPGARDFRRMLTEGAAHSDNPDLMLAAIPTLALAA